jgi:hypothetical protein
MKQKSPWAGFFGASMILVAAAGFCSMVWLSQPPHTQPATDQGNFHMTTVVVDPHETLISTTVTSEAK